ncbi:MAG: hypothetical protein HY680_10725 [Chloroflexi bacterium]|nr:hypothetical protein [Chloroflexota bacterium]
MDLKLRLAVVILPVLAIFLAAVPVAGQMKTPELLLAMDPVATSGKEVVIEAYLRDVQGKPVAGEVVTFFVDGEFLNIAGSIRLGSVTTDDDGRARLLHVFPQEGERTLTARFDGNGTFGAVETSNGMFLKSGGQLYEEASPYRMPGTNIAIVVGVLSTTWIILAAVTALLCLVGRAGIREERLIEARRLRVREGGVPA